MAKAATETTTKTARKARTTTAKKASGDRPKRAPSAYNVYMSEHLKSYREAHPGVGVKDAMKEVAVMWRDAPENPNRGKTPAERKPKEKAAPKAPSKRSSKKTSPPSEGEGPQVEPGSDE